MNGHIWAFVAFGLVFGVLTYSNRHLFGEGPSKREASGLYDGAAGRVMWVLVASLLWPILLLTGVYGYWRQAQARRLARAPARPEPDRR